MPSAQETRAGRANSEVWKFFNQVSIFSLANGPIVFVLANNKDRVLAFYFVCVYVGTVYVVGVL